MTEEQIKQITREMIQTTSDVPSAWADEAWQMAKRIGVISGFNEEGTDDRPQARPSREQVVYMLMKAIEYAEERKLAWDGSIADSFAGGTGTASDPYKIETPAQLAYLADRVNGGDTFNDKHIKLISDINLNISLNNPIEWTPIGTRNNAFHGNFNGGGHSIHGLYINDITKNYQGLFGVSRGTIENLTIASGSVTAGDAVGAIAGSAKTLRKCINYIPVKGVINVAGIAAYIEYASISRCINHGDVISDRLGVGGIVGHFLGNSTEYIIEECVNTGNIKGLSQNSCAGILAGMNDLYQRIRVKNCINTGSINGYTFTGGIVGWGSTGYVDNSYSLGSVHSNNSTPAGVASYYSGVTSSYYLERGERTSDSARARSEEQLKQKSTYQNWDFDTIWTIDEGNDYPKLRWTLE